MRKGTPQFSVPTDPKPHAATRSSPFPPSLPAAAGWRGGLEAQKAQIEQFTRSSNEIKKMNRSSNNINNKSLQKGECRAWPECSHVPSGSGPAFPLLWPEGNDPGWNGRTSRSWPCPCQLLLTATLEPGHTFKEVKPTPSLALYQKSCYFLRVHLLVIPLKIGHFGQYSIV